MIRTLAATLAAFLTLASFATPSSAGLFAKTNKSRVVATVSLSRQHMILEVTDRRGKRVRNVFPVSTGRQGYETPMGTWRASWMDKDHLSDTYDNAPMPNSVFFSPGYAIHGTFEVSKLGQPVSHGCVRMALPHSEYFFQAVTEVGMERTKIVIIQ